MIHAGFWAATVNGILYYIKSLDVLGSSTMSQEANESIGLINSLG